MESFEKQKLIIEQATKSSSFFMLILGGQITLTGSIFKNSDNLELALVAMLAMLFASLLAFAIAEKNVRKICEKPNFKVNVLNWITLSKMPTSIESQYIFSSLSGLLFTASMICYVTFCYQTLT